MTGLQDESTRRPLALVIAQDDGAVGALPAQLRAAGFEVQRALPEEPLPARTEDLDLVVVDATTDPDSGLAALRRLRPDTGRPSILVAAVVAPEHRAEAAAAGADWLIDPSPGEDAVVPWLAVARQRAREAEQALREAHELLEIKVAARTAELEQATEALRASEQRYRGIVETAPLALVIWDRQCRVLSWNQGAEAMFGWREDEVLGKPFLDFLIPGDERTSVEQTVETLLRGDGPVHNVNDNVRRDGARLVMDWNTAILRGRRGETTGFLSVGIDITERVRMEERVRQAAKMEAVGQLAGGVAHDFNNQLVAVMGYSDLVHRTATDPSAQEHAGRILQATRRCADLVAKLLTFARRAPQQSEPLDAGALVADVVDLLRHSLPRRIIVEHDAPLEPLFTRGDASLLHSALLNLGLNARDAMPDGGTLSFRLAPVTIDVADCRRFAEEIAPGEYLEITVRDNGVGMDAGTQARIFEPFFTTKREGTGMGLAAVYGAICSHGGAIAVDSRPGRGSAFRLVLPREAIGVALGSDSYPELQTVGRGRILVVDDESLIRELLLNVLGDLGHEVVAYGNGRRALEHFRDHAAEIDLVILDVVMPEIDGIALLHELREIDPEARVLLSSGYDVDDQVSALEPGAIVGLLLKPYSVGEVERRVRVALGG